MFANLAKEFDGGEMCRDLHLIRVCIEDDLIDRTRRLGMHQTTAEAVPQAPAPQATAAADNAGADTATSEIVVTARRTALPTASR